MTGGYWVYEFLQSGVDGKHLLRFLSETFVFKLLQRSVDRAINTVVKTPRLPRIFSLFDTGAFLPAFTKTSGVSIRVGNRANWPAVRTILSDLFDHWEKILLTKKFSLKRFANLWKPVALLLKRQWKPYWLESEQVWNLIFFSRNKTMAFSKMKNPPRFLLFHVFVGNTWLMHVIPIPHHVLNLESQLATRRIFNMTTRAREYKQQNGVSDYIVQFPMQ